jgi:hypothetical protein
MRDSQYENDDLLDLGCRVLDMAEQIFKWCGAENDFCHQTGLVFGGTNRIILTHRGWEMDRSYCTEKFIEAFEGLKELGTI